MKKILVLFFICATVTGLKLQAQSMGHTYKTALGVKVWDGGGISIKHFINKKAALEGIAYFWGNGVRITGLYELHYPVKDAAGLQWYIGPGAHLGFYNRGNKNRYDDGTFIGIDGVLGLDYKINNAPINLSLDWNPSIEFGDGRGFWGGWGGLGVRYTF
jgi:hypothetical protein